MLFLVSDIENSEKTVLINVPDSEYFDISIDDGSIKIELDKMQITLVSNTDVPALDRAMDSIIDQVSKGERVINLLNASTHSTKDPIDCLDKARIIRENDRREIGQKGE
uniref:Uncharacterized protein n=1 Tax=viral metagenome TaxID=1070528 RepID=A0A6M3IH23_9ZZZZ